MRQGEGIEVEMRQIFENEDFGSELTPELKKKEDQLRVEAQRLAKAQ